MRAGALALVIAVGCGGGSKPAAQEPAPVEEPPPPEEPAYVPVTGAVECDWVVAATRCLSKGANADAIAGMEKEFVVGIDDETTRQMTIDACASVSSTMRDQATAAGCTVEDVPYTPGAYHPTAIPDDVPDGPAACDVVVTLMVCVAHATNTPELEDTAMEVSQGYDEALSNQVTRQFMIDTCRAALVELEADARSVGCDPW